MSAHDYYTHGRVVMARKADGTLAAYQLQDILNRLFEAQRSASAQLRAFGLRSGAEDRDPTERQRIVENFSQVVDQLQSESDAIVDNLSTLSQDECAQVAEALEVYGARPSKNGLIEGIRERMNGTLFRADRGIQAQAFGTM